MQNMIWTSPATTRRYDLEPERSEPLGPPPLRTGGWSVLRFVRRAAGRRWSRPRTRFSGPGPLSPAFDAVD